LENMRDVSGSVVVRSHHRWGWW